MNIAQIRMGKDFTVIWRVFKKIDGERTQYELKDKGNYTLRLLSPYGKNEITMFEIKNINEIHWDFFGKDQKQPGRYALELIERKNQVGMVTIDTCAFVLVPNSCSENLDGDGDVVIQTVQLEGELGLAPMVSLTIDTELSDTSHNAVANFVVTNKFKEVDEALKKIPSKEEIDALCPEEVFVFPKELFEIARHEEVEADGNNYVQVTDRFISKEQVESYYGCPYSEVYDKVSKAKMLSFVYGSSSLMPTTAAGGTDSFFAAFTTSAGTLSIELHFGIFKEEVDGYVFYVREWLPRLQQSTVFEELEKKVNKDEIATPDWNASEGESGYIKNRTHYFDALGKISSLAWDIDNSSNPRKAVIDLSPNYIYKFEYEDNTYYFKTDGHKDETTQLLDGGVFTITLKCVDDKYSLEIVHYSQDLTSDFIALYEANITDALSLHQLLQLHEIFIPDSIARSEDLEELQSTLLDETGALWENVERVDGELTKKAEVHIMSESIDGFESIIKANDDIPMRDADVDAILSGKLIAVNSPTNGYILADEVYYDEAVDNPRMGFIVFHYSEKEVKVVFDLTNKVYLGSQSYIKAIAQMEYVDERCNELAEELESNGVLIEDLQNTKIDKEADDYYPQLSVGLADNLVGVDVVDSSFTFRKSGGGAIADGTARIEAIKGNSVVWNQKVKEFAFWNLQGGTIEGNEVVWSASNRTGALNAYSNTFAQHTTHKYLISADVKAFSTNVGLGLYYTGSPLVHHSGSGQYERLAVITQGRGDGTDACYLTDVSTSGYGEIRAKNYRCRDLTQMFGAGNEPRTIEEFNARKPLGVDENAYNEGTIIDTTANSIVSRGFNQWDGEWEQGDINSVTGENRNSSAYWRTKNFIQVIPNEEYIIVSNKNHAFIRARFYDVNKVFLGIEDAHEKDVYENESFKVPSNAHYLRFAPDPNFTSHEDLIVHLANTSHIASQNESYISRVQSLSIVQRCFPEGMKSVGTAHDEIRYNKTTQKWEKVEAIGTRAYQEGDADNASYLTDGKVTCYPLAEPIVTELEDSFNLDYEVWNGGTEKIVSDVPTTPLNAEIVYGFNAYGKIKENAQKIKELEKNGASGYDDTEIRQQLTELSEKIDRIFGL